MLIVSMIVKVKSEAAQVTLEAIEKIENLTTYGVHKDDNIIVVGEVETVDEIEALSKKLLNEFDAILGVFPTYLADEDA